MTELQQEIITAYEKYGSMDGEKENIEVLRNIAEEVYEDRNATTKVRSVIHNLRNRGEWPFDQKKEEKESSLRTAISTYDIETDTIVKFTKYLNCLENSKSMKKIVESVKNGAFTKNEMYILTAMAKLFDELNDEQRKRVFNYIGERFKL